MNERSSQHHVPEFPRRWFPMLAAGLFVILFACTDMGTEPGPGDNALCYVKSHNDHWEIFTNNLSGTNPQNISNYAGDDEYPQWSPNGRYIVYSRSVPVNGPLIIVYDTKTNISTNLTSDGGGASQQPQWTPDNRVCFGYPFAWAPYRGTYIMNPDGNNRKRILDVTATVYFYQDSYTFLYKNGTEIYKTNLDGTSNEFIVNTQPSLQEYMTIRDFNPMTHKLLVNTNTMPGIWNAIAEFDVSARQVNVVVTAEDGFVLAGQRYSRDYSKIAFIETDTVAYRHHHLSLFENGEKRRLVELTGSIVEGEWFDYKPMQFSPDNRWVAFSKNVSGGGGWVSWTSYLHLVDVATGELYYIDEGFGPSWNPKAATE